MYVEAVLTLLFWVWLIWSYTRKYGGPIRQHREHQFDKMMFEQAKEASIEYQKIMSKDQTQESALLLHNEEVSEVGNERSTNRGSQETES